ncbi:hypothetical protein VPNG_10358 [Cytospora leucostoma]|uniref:Uncharacterized protein n=1 Tax=Cytospora leucostoma TaxID=1230097 RepID=A0A423VC28_9PEZI|nr:hypothetical protein VPNG_10358 [Cytospora leucostoma]
MDWWSYTREEKRREEKRERKRTYLRRAKQSRAEQSRAEQTGLHLRSGLVSWATKRVTYRERRHASRIKAENDARMKQMMKQKQQQQQQQQQQQ